MAEVRRDGQRIRAILLVEEWWHADREAAARPVHPLVTVQEMHLVDGEGGTVRGAQKRSGRSMPLVRDLPSHLRFMDGVMRHVWAVNPAWRKALEGYAEHGTVSKAAEHMRMKPARLWRDFNNGVVVVQSELVRQGH